MLFFQSNKKNAIVPKWSQISEKEEISWDFILSNQQETLVWLGYKKYLWGSWWQYLLSSFIKKSFVWFEKGLKSYRLINRGVFVVGERRIPKLKEKWRKLELFFFLWNKLNGIWREEKV